MSKRKVHKGFYSYTNVAYCSFDDEGNWIRHPVTPVSWFWRDVTCKRCLKKRKGK